MAILNFGFCVEPSETGQYFDWGATNPYTPLIKACKFGPSQADDAQGQGKSSASGTDTASIFLWMFNINFKLVCSSLPTYLSVDLALAQMRRNQTQMYASPQPQYHQQSREFLDVDSLPQFFTLTNSEDREKKAKYQRAGTYNEIVNSESFVDFEEYRDSRNPAPFAPVRESDNIQIEPVSIRQTQGRGLRHVRNETQVSNDPDIIIVKVFKDDTHRSDTPERTCAQCQSSRTPFAISSSFQSYPWFSYNNSLPIETVTKEGIDHRVFCHYTTFVRHHLAQVHRDSLGTSLETGELSAPDVFERQAATFPPFCKALMAFCALSISNQSGVANPDALQHYQDAISLIQAYTEPDLTSDGPFLTHFVLLLYEIAAGGPQASAFWSILLDQLLLIIPFRRNFHNYEPYSFIIWWVASIDIHVVLSGMGHGKFIETIVRQNMLPSGTDPRHQYHPFIGGPFSGLEALPTALAFHRRILLQAAEMGLMARDFRREETTTTKGESQRFLRSCLEKIGQFQDTLRLNWNVQMPHSEANGYCNNLLPVGERGIFEHTFALYHACIIYSHTSMFRTQCRFSLSFTNHEVAHCANEILRLAREIVSHNHVERKFIVFPLFMAGFVSKTREGKAEILDLIRRMEQDSVGRNILAARKLLEIVYERQHWGQPWNGNVDWVELRKEFGFSIVNCRL